MLVEKSSIKAEENILQIKNRVENFENKLIDVSLFLSLALNLKII